MNFVRFGRSIFVRFAGSSICTPNFPDLEGTCKPFSFQGNDYILTKHKIFYSLFIKFVTVIKVMEIVSGGVFLCFLFLATVHYFLNEM